MPYVSALADFREKVRDIAREEKGTCIHVHVACFIGETTPTQIFTHIYRSIVLLHK